MLSGKGNLQKQCFLTLKTCVFHLLSSPTLEEVQKSRCAKDVGCQTSESWGGRASQGPWNPLVFHLVSIYSALSL